MSERDQARSAAGAGWKHSALLGLVIILAFGLRAFRLGCQELRGDEAFDALFVMQPVGEILTQLRINQPYPPLFHVGLHYWLALVGQGEVGQRLPALIGSVLVVPLVYALARQTLNRTTALIAAALAAINPFYIWHAQDGRMYSLLAASSLASTWLGLRLLEERPKPWVGPAYWASTVFALLTHYFAWWVILAENLAAALVIWREWPCRPRLRRWLMWQVLVILPLIPWLLYASGLLISHTGGWIPSFTLPEMLRRGLVTFSVGTTAFPAAAIPFALVTVALFLLGLLFPFRDGLTGLGRSGRGPLLVFAAVPFLATALLSLKRPAFDEKYLIAVVAPYLILVAQGLYFLLRKAKVLGLVAGVALVFASGWSLSNYYFDPSYAKSPGWRRLVASVQTRGKEGDVIVYNYPDPGLRYYYRGELPVQLLPADPSEGREQAMHTLEDLAATYRRIWLVPTPGSTWDPQGLVEQWLSRHSDLVDEQSFGSLPLRLYHTPQTFLDQMQAVNAQVGGQIELLGYRLDPTPDEPLRPGDRLTVTLYWRALEPVDADYTVFVHLSDPSESIISQDDSQPVGGTYPTSAWTPGQIVADRHILQTDGGAPAGQYRLMTGLYDGTNGQRLPSVADSNVVTDNRIILCEVWVSAAQR